MTPNIIESVINEIVLFLPVFFQSIIAVIKTPLPTANKGKPCARNRAAAIKIIKVAKIVEIAKIMGSE